MSQASQGNNGSDDPARRIEQKIDGLLSEIRDEQERRSRSSANAVDRNLVSVRRAVLGLSAFAIFATGTVVGDTYDPLGLGAPREAHQSQSSTYPQEALGLTSLGMPEASTISRQELAKDVSDSLASEASCEQAISNDLKPKHEMFSVEYINSPYLHGFADLRKYVAVVHIVPKPTRDSDYIEPAYGYDCYVSLPDGAAKAYGHEIPLDRALMTIAANRQTFRVRGVFHLPPPTQ